MNPKTKNSSEYLKTKVLTASPEQLQLMLYDGAIRFCEQARHAICDQQIEQSFYLICRAENIIIELCNSMKVELAPETCANMRRLYLFCYDRLLRANLKKDLCALDEALRILRHLRETWTILMDKIKQEKFQNAADRPADNPSAYPSHHQSLSSIQPQEVGTSINFEG